MMPNPATAPAAITSNAQRPMPQPPGWAPAAIVLIAASALVELHRAQPLLHIRWLSSADMLRLVVIILLFRIVLSEQGVGAFGFLRHNRR